MVDINVYIESSFIALSSGTEDAFIDYSVEEADSIGEFTIPVDYRLVIPNSGIQYVSTEYTTISGSDGFTSTAITYQHTNTTTMSGVLTSLVEYGIPVSVSGLSDYLDADLEYFVITDADKIPGHRRTYIDSVMGEAYIVSDNIFTQYWIFSSVSGSLNYDTLYTAGGDYDPTDPFDYVIIYGTADYLTHFSAGNQSTLVSGSVRAFIDSRFSGFVYYFKPDELSYKFDLTCGLETILHGYDFDSTAISGAVTQINYDVYSTIETSSYIDTDGICGVVNQTFYFVESTVISGGLGYQDWDAYCGVVNTNGFNFDVDLFSLKISNFSLAEGEYSAASGTVCVDVTDDVYNVVTSGTYFIIDETVTSGTFTPITDGHRMCYDPVDNFASLLGSTTLTVYAQNDNGDILERDFYVTSGCLVEYDNETQDYGFGNTVVVRMTAENFASCPLTNTDAYWFTTVQKITKDLTATIIGIPWGELDLGASITPQTDTIFFYGKVFTVEIRAKDFAGNEMTPYIFEFQIEDKPD